MTCSARIPVYTLIISAFIPARQIGGWVNLQGLVMFGLYARHRQRARRIVRHQVLHAARLCAGAVHAGIAGLQDAARRQHRHRHLYEAKMFLQRAGTTIFSMMVLIWFLASFPLPPSGATDPAINYSFAAMIARRLAPLLMPIGFNWQIAVAADPGMAAREVAVCSPRHGLCHRGGKEAAEQIGQVLATKWSLAHRAVRCCLVHLCPAMRLHAGRDSTRDRNWKWMASPSPICWPSLCREPCYLQYRLRPRRR